MARLIARVSQPLPVVPPRLWIPEHASRRDVLRAALAGVAGMAGTSITGCVSRTPADTRVHLELWTIALSTPALRAFMVERIAEFERENPGVRVEWVDVPFEAVDRKLIATAAAGRAPDVVNLSDVQFGRFAGLGALADLDRLLPGDPGSVYLPGAMGLGRIGTGLKALPWYLTTQVSMINTEMTSSGGLNETNIAHDWAGLREQAQAFRAKTGKYLFSQPLGAESQIPVMMLGEGIVPLRGGADGRVEPDLQREDVAAFVGAWVEFYRSGAMPPEAATRDHSHLTDMYKNGTLGMIDTGPNFLSRVKSDSPRVLERTRVRAGMTGALGRQHIATMVLGVTSSCKHPAEAARLAWHMTSAASQTQLCRTAMVLPSARASLEDPVVRGEESLPGTEPESARARGLAAASLTDAVAFTPALAAWPDLRRAFEEGIKSALLDGRETRRTLREIDAQWRQILLAGAPERMDAVPRPGPVRSKSSSGAGGAS